MNLSHLHYFRKLAEIQHYAKAAKQLNITQPSLSNAISSLEQELGVSLFQRTGRNIQLTKYGQEFLVYVSAGLERIDKGVDIMKEYAGVSEGGKIDLGCIITVQTEYIPRLLNGYKFDADTSVSFNVREDTSVPLTAGLMDGTYDVVFSARGTDDPSIVYTPVLSQKVVVAMSRTSPLAEKEFIVPGDLAGYPVISYSDTIPLGKAVKDRMETLAVDGIAYEYLDESILAGFASNGVEVALMLDTFFLKSVERIEVRPFYNDAEEKKTFHHRIYMAYSDANYHPRCVDRFIEYVTLYKQLDEAGPDEVFID